MGEVLIGSKPPPSLLHACSMTSCSSEGSRAENRVPEPRAAFYIHVLGSLFPLNCKNPEIHVSVKPAQNK